MQPNAIESYLGFAIKAGKLIYGIDNIKGYHKKSYLIIVSSTATKNLLDEALRQANRLHTPLMQTTSINLETLLHKENTKIVLLKDHGLTKAILDKNQSLNLLKEVKTI